MNTKILSLNSTLSLQSKGLPKKYPDAILIDPADPLSIVPWVLCSPQGNMLKGDDFSNLAYGMQNLKVWVENFLNQGGLVVAMIRPYTCFQHINHPDLKIGNYDWLWEEAGQDSRLIVRISPPDTMELTEYGSDSPFSHYLQEEELRHDVIAEGELQSLAINRFRKPLAFTIKQGKGRIVFLPRAKKQTSKASLLKAIDNALNQENWPEIEIIKEIKPKWAHEYFWPENAILEEILAKKEEQISLLEEECEEIHEKLCHFNQLRSSLFCCNPSTMGNSLASILVQWGVEVYPKGQILEIVSGKRRGFLLLAVCKKEAELWRAKKLLRLLPDNYKGILVVNPHCYEHPKRRPGTLYSSSFVDFAKEHNFSIVNICDIVQSHQEGNKNLMEKMWTTGGVVSVRKNSLETL